MQQTAPPTASRTTSQAPGTRAARARARARLLSVLALEPGRVAPEVLVVQVLDRQLPRQHPAAQRAARPHSRQARAGRRARSRCRASKRALHERRSRDTASHGQLRCSGSRHDVAAARPLAGAQAARLGPPRAPVRQEADAELAADRDQVLLAPAREQAPLPGARAQQEPRIGASAATAASQGRLCADRTRSSWHPVIPAAPGVARWIERRFRQHAPGTRAPRQRCALVVTWSGTARAQAPWAAAAHISTSVMGWIACARRTWAGATSDSPRYFTLPSSTIACAAALRQARRGSRRAVPTTNMLRQSTVPRVDSAEAGTALPTLSHRTSSTWHGGLSAVLGRGARARAPSCPA